MSDTWVAAIFGIGGILLGSGIAFFGQWFTVRAENKRWRIEKKFEALNKKKNDLVKVLTELNQILYGDRKLNFELLGNLLASDPDLLLMVINSHNAFSGMFDKALRDKLDGKTIDVDKTVDEVSPHITNVLTEVSRKIHSIEKEIDKLTNAT